MAVPVAEKRAPLVVLEVVRSPAPEAAPMMHDPLDARLPSPVPSENAQENVQESRATRTRHPLTPSAALAAARAAAPMPVLHVQCPRVASTLTPRLRRSKPPPPRCVSPPCAQLFLTPAAHQVGTAEELYGRIMRVNSALRSRPASAWPERVRGKPLDKATSRGLYLGLDEYAWLDLL